MWLWETNWTSLAHTACCGFPVLLCRNDKGCECEVARRPVTLHCDHFHEKQDMFPSLVVWGCKMGVMITSTGCQNTLFTRTLAHKFQMLFFLQWSLCPLNTHAQFDCMIILSNKLAYLSDRAAFAISDSTWLKGHHTQEIPSVLLWRPTLSVLPSKCVLNCHVVSVNISKTVIVSVVSTIKNKTATEIWVEVCCWFPVHHTWCL